jgi:hypothetical protein
MAKPSPKSEACGLTGLRHTLNNALPNKRTEQVLGRLGSEDGPRHRPETEFEEIGARTALRTTAFPLSGLGARDCFRLPRRGALRDSWVDLPQIGGVDEKLFLQYLSNRETYSDGMPATC